MKLPLLSEILEDMPGYKRSGDGTNITIRCPFCGGSNKDQSSLSIKIDVEKNEPIWYQCFRASCARKGALNTITLQEMGITDINVLMEVASHNKNVNGMSDKPFISKGKREYTLVNLPIKLNIPKIEYINRRLGTELNANELGMFKIQLSIKELLRINQIKRLSLKPSAIDLIDQYCIGFISMYNDYMICRDISPNLITGKRYYMYRISGKPSPDDLKIYCIPREIDIMEPKTAIINIAEGPFSIVGAYINTNIGCEKPNSIWLANCGSQYHNTIMHVCKQYGLLKVRINIWSDSEIKPQFYQKLYSQLKNKLDIRRMTVYYNDKFEDWGTSKKNMKIREVSIY